MTERMNKRMNEWKHIPGMKEQGLGDRSELNLNSSIY